MNALQFFTAQLEADQRFRDAFESFNQQFEVNNAPNPQPTAVPPDNGLGQLPDNGQSNQPGGNVLPAAPV